MDFAEVVILPGVGLDSADARDQIVDELHPLVSQKRVLRLVPLLELVAEELGN